MRGSSLLKFSRLVFVSASNQNILTFFRDFTEADLARRKSSFSNDYTKITKYNVVQYFSNDNAHIMEIEHSCHSVVKKWFPANQQSISRKKSWHWQENVFYFHNVRSQDLENEIFLPGLSDLVN